jgi:acyl-CoA reductase-like NAD-dependent aldehyde dehydrogenase
LELRALIGGWQPTLSTRLFLDADKVARDPVLALAASGAVRRGGRRLFARGPSAPQTPEERFTEVYRRNVGPMEVSQSRIEEAAFARVHLADMLLVGRALEHGLGQHARLRSISPGTRAQLLREMMVALDGRADDMVRMGAAEGRTRKGMEWELERIRAYLAPEVLEGFASRLGKHKYKDGTRLFVEGLGTVGAMVPTHGGPSRAVLSLACSLMTGNFTFLSAPPLAPLTTMLVADVAHEVLEAHRVDALSAMVPDGSRELLGILSESPRVDALVMFEQGSDSLEAAAQATALDKSVVGAWDTVDVAVVWDGADLVSAARAIVRSRFTDTGRLPSSIGRVLVHKDVRDETIKALVNELSSLRVGLPTDHSTDVGPVGSLATLEHLQEVVSEAMQLGARLVHGGERINWKSEADPLGLYFQPTLLDECDTGMRIMNEPIVGPVLPVCSVPDAESARALSCVPRRPGRVWIWATSRADRDRLVDGLRAPGILFFGRQPECEVRAVDLSDAWGALELAERLSYKSWRGPVGQ